MAQDSTFQIPRLSHRITPDYGGRTIHEHLTKLDESAESKRRPHVGRKEHPFRMDKAIDFKDHNIHHSTCIEAKRDATIGLGFTSDAAEDVLNEMCEVSFHHTINDQVEDYWQVGNSYLEIVREEPRRDAPIIGIHHVQAPVVYRNIQEDRKFWETVDDRDTSIPEPKFAEFGDWESLEEFGTSEIIAWPRPTSRDRWYGWPDWIAAAPVIELVQCMIQHEFDFFLNRGVPEFLLFLLNGNIDQKTWEDLQKNLKGHIGLGNAFKSSVYNLPSTELKVQLEKLGLGERQQGVFSEYSDATALMIVSAHRVPSLLAGIQIPGKLGATNELPNALMAFQLLVIGQSQRSLKTVLDRTLGNKELNGGLVLPENAFEFKTILDEMNLNEMDTVSRMRTPAADQSRDPADGLRD